MYDVVEDVKGHERKDIKFMVYFDEVNLNVHVCVCVCLGSLSLERFCVATYLLWTRIKVTSTHVNYMLLLKKERKNTHCYKSL